MYAVSQFNLLSCSLYSLSLMLMDGEGTLEKEISYSCSYF